MYIFKKEDYVLSIKNEKTGETEYFIQIDQLHGVIEDNVSKIVFHLSEKSWVTLQLLYDLAKEIQKIHPTNEIDWKLTFFYVEKEAYVDTIVDVVFDGKQGVVHKILRDLDFAAQETNFETHQIIFQIVEKRLEEFGLRSK